MAIEILPGQPYPLGATYDGMGTNFSVFSEVAERVELCLFDADGTETRVDLPEMDAYCWHGYLPNMGPGQRYGFRVHGPYDPGRGPALQPVQAPPRPLRQGGRGRGRVGRAAVQLPVRRPRTARRQRRRQRALHAQGGGHQPLLRLGQRPPPPHPVARVGGLRGPRQGLHQAPPRASPRSCGAPTPAWPTRCRSTT